MVLAFEAKGDAKSWVAALQSDLKWLGVCDHKAVYNVTSWFTSAREEPKRARNLIRRICDSMEARSTTLAEQQKAIISLKGSHTCHCGRSFDSQPALDGHRVPDARVRLPM